MPYYPPASASDSTKLPLAGGTMTGTITSTIGTVTASTPVLSATQTWNNSGVVFKGIFLNITKTAASSSSLFADFQGGGTSLMTFGADSSFTSGIIKCNRFYCGTSDDKIDINMSVGMTLASNRFIKWASDAFLNSPDTGLYRNDVNFVEANTGTAGTFGGFVAKEFRFAAPTSANGQYAAAKSLTELTTIAAAATTDTTIQMPANSIILAVSVRVTTVIPTATNFTVGDSGSATRFSTAAVSSAATSTDPGTKAGAYYNSTATSVRITPDATPASNTGRVRVTIHYIQVTPPTS